MAAVTLSKNKLAQAFVIECLALGKSSADILPAVKEEFGIKTTDENLSYYRREKREEILEKRRELEKQILDKFPLAYTWKRMQELGNLYKEADKIGSVDEDKAEKLLQGLEGRDRREAVIGLFGVVSDGINERIARKQSILKQIAVEVGPIRKDAGKDDDDEKGTSMREFRMALKAASDKDLNELERVQERLLKHAKAG